MVELITHILIACCKSGRGVVHYKYNSNWYENWKINDIKLMWQRMENYFYQIIFDFMTIHNSNMISTRHTKKLDYNNWTHFDIVLFHPEFYKMFSCDRKFKCMWVFFQLLRMTNEIQYSYNHNFP